MIIEKHPLAVDYPEFKDRIHDLKISDAHFAKKFEQYNDLDKEIIRFEEGFETPSDEHLEGLKLQRLQLKDELVAMLRA